MLSKLSTRTLLTGSIILSFGLLIWLISLAPVMAHAARPLQQLATDQQAEQPSEFTVDVATSFTSIVAADEHTCGLTTNGRVSCWGDNVDGQAGDGTGFVYRPPVAVAGLTSGVQAIAANGGHTCALLSSGGVSCWGNNRRGQLGDGSTSERRVPVAVLGLTEAVVALAAGAEHSCALLLAGGVACWGNNQAGQLGNGTNLDQKTPVAVTGLADKVSALTAGANYTCALLQNRTIQCWGDNTDGQLGDGSTVQHNTPVSVSGLADAATSLSAGSAHACAVLVDGRVQCWGDNARGQLGDGSLESSRTPVRVVATPGDATALAAGFEHACALFKSGTVYCWGSNRARQLGQGAPGVSSIPRLIQPAALVDQPAPVNGIPHIVGGRYHTCLITPSRGAQCWGRNSDGQVGDGTQLPQSRPVNVTSLSSGVSTLALGAEHSCALTQNGIVQCWGSNQAGQLGDGTTIEKMTPTAVIGLAGSVAAIATGDNHTCALIQPGSVTCWGANAAGQLGDGTTTVSPFPVAVLGLQSGVIALTAGATHTCALLQSGAVKCWGGNSTGQLGDGSQINRLTPVDVIGLGSGVIALAAGSAHTCAITSNGSIQCWGDNRDAQLGDGSRVNQAQPVAVAGLPAAATLVTAGVSHTCALLADQQAVCWGGNEYSQLGDGTHAERVSPTVVSGLSANVLALSAGGYHTCALVTGNRPLCWGRDSDGQLATGVLTQSTTPVMLVETYPATLRINYPTAQVGSVLILFGNGFPDSSTLPLIVNETIISETLPINPSGEFILYLTTQAADTGVYTVQVGNPPSATVTFLLQARAPHQPAEGGGVTLALPAGIGQPINEIYLPKVNR